MTKETLKVVFSLTVMFFADLLNPLRYSQYCEFIFLGIIFLSLNFPLEKSLPVSILFGYFSDCVSFGRGHFYMIEFSAISIICHYFLSNFQKKTVKTFIFFGVIFAHLFFSSWRIGYFSLLYGLYFIINSSFIFFVLNRLLTRWIKSYAV